MFLLTHGILTCYVHVNLYTTPAKSINSIVAKRGVVLLQSPWIGIPKLNIPIISIMSLSTYEATQSSQKNVPNDSIESIGLNICFLFWKLISLPLFGRRSTPWTLFGDILNQFIWSNHNSPSKSIDSVTYFMKLIDALTNQLTWKRNWINSINFAVPN